VIIVTQLSGWLESNPSQATQASRKAASALVDVLRGTRSKWSASRGCTAVLIGIVPALPSTTKESDYRLMRILLQRVSRAEVRIHTNAVSAAPHVSGRIGAGYVALVGITHTDTLAEAQWMSDKIVGLRLFPDDEGKMNRDLREHGGSLLVVSQFTLYGDARKGRRPSFIDAAPPPIAQPLYDNLVALLRAQGLAVETGIFGAMMDVELVNDGPVTIWLEREAAGHAPA
jgi:D-tyrosyl-tRNA(Tyr) deacylase